MQPKQKEKKENETDHLSFAECLRRVQGALKTNKWKAHLSGSERPLSERYTWTRFKNRRMRPKERMQWETGAWPLSTDHQAEASCQGHRRLKTVVQACVPSTQSRAFSVCLNACVCTQVTGCSYRRTPVPLEQRGGSVIAENSSGITFFVSWWIFSEKTEEVRIAHHERPQRCLLSPRFRAVLRCHHYQQGHVPRLCAPGPGLESRPSPSALSMS